MNMIVLYWYLMIRWSVFRILMKQHEKLCMRLLAPSQWMPCWDLHRWSFRSMAAMSETVRHCHFQRSKNWNFVGFLRPETLAAAVVGLGAPGSLGGLSGLSAHLLDDMSNEGFDMRVESEWATVGWWLAVPQECKASGVEGSWLRCECILRRWIRRDLEATCSWVRVFTTHWTCKRYTSEDGFQQGL